MTSSVRARVGGAAARTLPCLVGHRDAQQEASAGLSTYRQNVISPFSTMILLSVADPRSPAGPSPRRDRREVLDLAIQRRIRLVEELTAIFQKAAPRFHVAARPGS